MNEKLNDFRNELAKTVTGPIRCDELYRTLYSTDASIYQVKPFGVFIPRSEKEVQAAIALAAKHQIAILPRGAGTSLAGQAVNEALVIDTTRYLDKIITINPEEKWVRAQAGVVLGSLNAQLKPHGLKYGPDPASGNRAVLGGIIGNNSSGSHSILYGMSADHVLATRVILADGSLVEFAPKSGQELAQLQLRTDTESEIYRRMLALVRDPHNLRVIREKTPPHWRRCGGYNLDRLTDGTGLSFRWKYDPRFNLAKLMCGSEGTLGFISEVTLNLVDLPKRTGLSVLHFGALRAALDAVPIMLEVEPTAIELIDHYGLTQVKNVPHYAQMMQTFVQGDPNCILITEFYGESLHEIETQQQRLATHLQKHGVPVTASTNLTEPGAIQTVWKLREASFGILMNMRGDVKPLPIVDDAAVPPVHLADYISELETFCNQELDHQVAYFAHASAGCLHVHSLLNAKLAADIAKMPKIVEHAGELLNRYGGVLSSEHGDGRLRSWLNPYFYGDELYGLFKQVKGIFDPHNLFNPGDIVDAPAMTENLRYGAGYHALPFTPTLNFADTFGFDGAIEMCNGAAVCRQLTGTMCPTFKATRDEQHSTRGRANALRAAISNQIDFSNPGVYETLDLCVSCKACKSECPSSVDMAKIKAGYLAQYYQHHSFPLRSRFFSYFGDLSRLAGGAMAPLSNALLKNTMVRGGMNRVLDLASARPMPAFARQTFDDWYSHRPPPADNPVLQTVVLLVDVVRTYNHPQVARAALAVLEKCGFKVIVPPIHDFGRAAFSKGDLKLARSRVERALQFLAPYAQNEIPIVGLEPSDISMFIDDNVALVPQDTRVKEVADKTLTFEEFLWREMQAGHLERVFQPQSGAILLHGHCHQKALIGTRYSQELLAFLGYRVTEAGSGCCGMAGSFGYEAEHYALSMKLGELTLFPAVQAQSPDTLIVAAGISCHEQIEHGTQRSVLHPAQVLFQALA